MHGDMETIVSLSYFVSHQKNILVQTNCLRANWYTQVDSTSGQAAALPWPSPQDANGVYQKLAKRVEARVRKKSTYITSSLRGVFRIM